MVRIGLMPKRISRRLFPVHRREFLAGFGATILVPALSRAAAVEPLLLRAVAGTMTLRPGKPNTPVWTLQAPNQTLRFRRGSELAVILRNELPEPVALDWRGLDGVAAAEPLVSHPSIAPSASANVTIPLLHAGTFFCDIKLLGNTLKMPSTLLPFLVEEDQPVLVDRDEVFLVEDWRLRDGGAAVPPGVDPKDAALLYTVNGNITPDIAVRTHERLRLRFINGCQRHAIAVKIEGHDVRVMALDGEPAEPFLARNGALVLAPGGRSDAFIDVTSQAGSTSQILLHDGTSARPIARLVTSTDPPVRPSPQPAAPPLPSNGLPARLDLGAALRIDVPLAGSEWVAPSNFALSGAPAFQAKAARTVVLALTNRGDSATVFHLHGHHFRLLDRLDDGWKPFWLDTLVVEPAQTQRIAFLAEHAGRWLLESVGTDWTAPRLMRWYDVD